MAVHSQPRGVVGVVNRHGPGHLDAVRGAAGREERRLCKVGCAGRLCGVQLDGARPDCFEWLCTQLDLDPRETTMSVAASPRGKGGEREGAEELRRSMKAWPLGRSKPMSVCSDTPPTSPDSTERPKTLVRSNLLGAVSSSWAPAAPATGCDPPAAGKGVVPVLCAAPCRSCKSSLT